MPPDAGTQLGIRAFMGRRLTAVISTLGRAACRRRLAIDEPLCGRRAVNMLCLSFATHRPVVSRFLFVCFFPFDGWVDVRLRDEHHRCAGSLWHGVAQTPRSRKGKVRRIPLFKAGYVLEPAMGETRLDQSFYCLSVK